MGSCKPSPVAAMRKRVTIQNVATSPDGQGGFSENWVDGDTVWASIEPASGYQRFQAMQMQAPVTHNIVIRYRPDVTANTRFRYGTRIFGVNECLNTGERDRFLEIRAVERAAFASETDIGALLLETGAYLRLNGGGRLLLGA